MNNFTNSNNASNTSSQNITIQYVRTGTLLLCMSVGMFTNILFIVTISKSRSLYRRSLFGLCLNLDCIFLLDIFFNQSLTVVASIRNGWDFPETMCIAQSFSVHVVDTCLSLTLFMLGIDRLIAVRSNIQNNPKHAKGLTRDSVSLSILCLWLLSICFSIPLVTNTIPSVFFSEKFACLPQLNFNLIYTLSNLLLTILVPIICVSAMYIHIAVVWYREKREIETNSPASITFQIETEVSSAVFTAVLHFLWLLIVGPYLTWIYLPNLPQDISVIVSWMRHFFSWIPFIAMILYHKPFRKTFATVFIGYKYRSSSASNIEPPNLSPSNVYNSEHIGFTNIAFNNENPMNHSLYKDDEFSSTSESRASSMFSNRLNNFLPKFPILFADGAGVHVVHNNLSNSPSFSSSARDGATLCDIRQNSFTDASDTVSRTTDSSFKQNNAVQRQSCDVNLPADITDMYNCDDNKGKRIKRRPQLRKKSLINTLEAAFESPVDSNTNQKSNIEFGQIPAAPQPLIRKVLKDSLISIKKDTVELKKGNNPQQKTTVISDSAYCDNSSFVLDYIGSTNA